MKQEIISYLSTIKDEIINISRFIHENPEISYQEIKTSKYISDILIKYNFNVKNNFLDMKTSFYGEIGSGHPKICFLCDYDSSPNLVDTLGNNLITAMSIGAALGASKVIDKTGGTIVVIGCPGELNGGSKTIMVKEKVFNDIDAVLMARPHVTTCETGSSMATLPIEINYNSNKIYQGKEGVYSALEAGLFTLQGLSVLINGYDKNCFINGISIKPPTTPHFAPTDFSTTLYLKAKNMTTLCHLEKKIKHFIKTTESLMNITSEIHFHQTPCDELISSKTLSRIFSHNLKECGIIDIAPPRDTHLGMSLGSVSFEVPCICPYICITDDKSILPYSIEFSKATTSTLAEKRILSAIEALAITALDLLEKDNLLIDGKQELFSHKKVNCIT